MLATSSSDEDDFDNKHNNNKKIQSNQLKSQAPPQQSSFLTSQQQKSTGFTNYSQPNTPNLTRNLNISANQTANSFSKLNLVNGDTTSVRSSFSSETDSINNFNQTNRNQSNASFLSRNQQNNSSFRNSSFRSNSSTSTIGNATLTNQSLSTPRTAPRKNSNRPIGNGGGGGGGVGGGRQLPRPPGADNISYTSSMNGGRNGEYDSDNDNSEYNYESHYISNQNQLFQNSDDERSDNFINDADNQSMNDDNDSSMNFNSATTTNKKSKSKTVNESIEDQERLANEAALAAQQNEALKEAEMHKKRLQIYVFVCRCIAYPFIAKQPTDMVRRQMKINKQQLQSLKDNFDLFLQNKMTNLEADEAFTNAVRSYYEVFLKSDRVTKMVASGGCSASDFRDVFKNNIEKRVRSLPEIDGLSKETVLTSWMAKFDAIFKYNEENSSTNLIASRRHSRNHLNQSNNSMSSECILTKEQLYDMFQNILGIKKFEHQLIFNAAQLDNADEQAATIRRELDSRMKQTENIQKQNGLMPKFVHKNMESTYIEELKQSISLLMNHLDNQPVGASESKLRLTKRPQNSKSDNHHHHHHDESEPCLSKSDVVLNFAIEVVVMEVKGLKSLPPNRIVFCVMEVEGHSKLQTDQAEASRPIWDTSGDFKTQQPLPVIKVKLCMETQNILQDNKELGRVVLRPDPNFTRASTWYVMDKTNSKFQDELKIKLTVRIDKPGNLKMCGWCYCMGKNVWKKWKKRYLCLVQVSQYTFVLCSYMEKKSEPRELMTLDNFTVDYADTDPDLKAIGGRFFFNAVKEGDNVCFATDEEGERQLWIQALYRATGQSHKPTPPSAIKSALLAREQGDADRARKHGMEEFIQADPSTFNHNDLFKMLQSLTLDFRLNDQFCCLGWFSPGQIFVLDEYQARYGVRGCYRHLCYLSDLLDRAEQGLIVDPTLLHYSFAFCACHVHGNRPDGIGTVTNEEKVKFDEIKERLKNLLEYQITHFRYCFPFGRPEGSLKQTLSLLERVLMKDIVTPVTPEEVKAVIRKCLENAALVNYTRISQVAKVEGGKDLNLDENDSLYNNETTPKKKIEDLIHLAELCIDLLQQNEEHHSETNLEDLFQLNYKKQTLDEFLKYKRLQKKYQKLLYLFKKYKSEEDTNKYKKFKLKKDISYLVKKVFKDETSLDCSNMTHFMNETDTSYLNLILTEKLKLYSYPKTQFKTHTTQSFAWFCELLVEHEEIFWSLFAVDMDHVIEQQSPDSWDSFPLFQLLNDYLRNHPSLNDGRFHRHLQDTFAPLVVRYVDLMESSIGQSIHKGFEKENWKNRGQGCTTSEDMLWKLDALQSFIKDLHWPDDVFAEHLEHRLKQMASDMIEACGSRVMKHFDSWMKKGIILLTTGTDYVFPQECCVMVNVIIDCKAQALKLCGLNSGDLHRYHTKIDEFLERCLVEMNKQLVSKLLSVLDGLLKKLSRYDEGTFFSSILSLTKPVNELGQSYVTFIGLNLDVLRQKINDELFILGAFEQWYNEQINMVFTWLTERIEISLHPYQLACLTLIVKKIRNNFELQGVSEKILETKTLTAILSRLNVEEANQALR